MNSSSSSFSPPTHTPPHIAPLLLGIGSGLVTGAGRPKLAKDGMRRWSKPATVFSSGDTTTPCSACFAFSDDTNFTVLYPISKLKNCRSMDEEPPPPNPQAEAEAEEEAAEEDWLQLGLGASTSSRGRETRQVAATELQLFRDRPSSSAAAGPSDASATGLSLSTPAPPASPELTVRPPQSSGEAAAAAAVARVVSPPRRQTDIWLNLQAFPDQGREGSVLPQIPSSYLRIKNGGVLTVRFLMRYIVRKLGLADEQEVHKKAQLC